MSKKIGLKVKKKYLRQKIKLHEENFNEYFFDILLWD